MNAQMELIDGLPGVDIIRNGLRDYNENQHTIASCLVRMARRRLVNAKLMEPTTQHDIDAELDLYQLLSHEGNQAHSRYNSLVRQLVSFEHALDHRLTTIQNR
jgi:2-phospho-L-lactate guanylyltransferase (CobY/MobA/RfbA family)